MKKSFLEASEEDKTKTFANTTVFYKNVDVEMVNLYMAYNKKKAEDPDFEFGSGPDQSLSTYAVWIFGGFGLASLKNNFIDPKFASGEWDKLAIPDPLHLFDAAGAAATAATP